jgi:hypothetical protein
MSKAEDITSVVAQKTAALYASGNETQIRIFEMLQLEKAIERGERPVDAMALVDTLRRIGAGLNEEERANAHSKDKAVELRAVETSIEQNLAASGKAPEEIALMLGVLKQVGALMAGGGVSQAQGDTITPSYTPNVAVKVDIPTPD